MVKDLTPKKKSQKDLILAAIELLKAKGFDINPYTVADEAGIPRSSLYRSTDYMDLLKEARGEVKGLGDTSIQSLHNHIHDLEERNKQLEESLWNLEAEAEKLSSEKQAAWNEGFQAGREDTVKRLAANRAAEIIEQPIPPPPVPAAPSVHSTQDMPAHKSVHSTQDMPAQRSFQPEAEPAATEQFQPAHAATEAEVPPSNGSMETPFPGAINTAALGLEPDRVSALALPQVTHSSDQHVSTNGAVTEARPVPIFAPPPGPEGVFNAARSGPYVQNTFNPLVELSWKDVETVYHYPTQNLDDMTNSAQTPEASGSAEVGMKELASPGWEDPSQTAPPPPKPVERRPSVEAMEAYKSYAYNNNLADEEEVEGVFTQKSLSSSSDSLFAISDDVLTQFEPAPPEPPSNWQQPSADAHQPIPHGELGSAAQAYAGVAQSEEDVKFVVPRQSYLDLGGGEEGEPQTSPHYQQQYDGAGTANPYGQTYGGAEQNPYGENYTNPAYEQQSAHYDPYGAPAAGAEQSYQYGYPSDFNEQEARAKGRQTGDKLQALHDPRDFMSSEPVVDLDALDIFDDLDDYVDLDKIDVIQDVAMPPHDEEDLKSAGDELRELIKGRIKQAADIPGEAAARHLGQGQAKQDPAAAGGAGDKGGAGMGARNKFVGGKAQQSTIEPGASSAPTGAPAGFMPKIPPDIRKHALILGLSPEPEQLTKEKVLHAWKNQISCVHPDLGGDTEAAVVLNTAKDALVRWLDAQAPKLGKKFGAKGPGPS